MSNLRRTICKSLVGLCAFLFIISLLISQVNSAVAAEGDACPKKQNEHLYWCLECKEIFTWNECGNLSYMIDEIEFEGKQHSEEVAKHKMVPSWSCLRTEYHCIRDGVKGATNPDGIFCEGSKQCLPYNIGACEICNDDLRPEKTRAKLNFKCTKCGKEFDEPGVGYEIDKKKEYAQHLLSFGNCKDCGEPLESVCKMSGTCPHIPDF